MIEPETTHRTTARRIKAIPYPIPQDLEARFWKKVTKTDSCWLWNACKVSGYGRISIGTSNKNVSSHRVSWTIHFGEIPNHLNVLHKCDVRTCVNPAHLFLGTNDDNMKDMVAKGRQRGVSGERNHLAKLTADDVQKIRYLRASLSLSLRKLAREFNVNHRTICHIMMRRTWKHI